MQISPFCLVFICKPSSFDKREVAVDSLIEAEETVEPVAGVVRACD